MSVKARRAVRVASLVLGFAASAGCFSLELRSDGPALTSAEASIDGPGEGSAPSDAASSPDADPTANIPEKLGDGHRGALTVDAVNKVVNTYTALASDAKAGAKTLAVASGASFVQGDLVLVVQSAGLTPGPASGAATPIALGSSGVGRWELARLIGIAGTQLVLNGALASDYAALGTQVVVVPEYTNVTIPAGTSLSAAPWDGRAGGVLAFYATGTIVNTGGLDVSKLGFRPGVWFRGAGTPPCAALDLTPPSGARKGEGAVTGSYGDAVGGYGNVANGAGGGNCSSTGGGGGGNGGAGGKGGSTDGADRGGRAGVQLQFDPLLRLSLGGGGGSGQGIAAGGTSGGRGGGVVLVRAGALTGTGFVRANGGSAAQSSGDSSGSAGAGGGGAGGTIHLRVSGALGCGGVEANGGNGGSSNGPVNGFSGPGGGGGGGRVVLQAASFSCPGGALAGAAGVGQDGSSHYSAEPSSPTDPAHVGSVDLLPTGL